MEQFGMARAGDERATPIDLVLDVVFVLAFSELTAYMVREQSWMGVVEGVIFLALLWRGWFGFVWLTSINDPDSAAVRTAVFLAMGAFVVMALITPQAFGDRPSGPYPQGGLLMFGFVGAYAVVRAVHVFLGLRASRGDVRTRDAVIRTSIGGVIAVVLAAWGLMTPLGVVHAMWILAVIVEYAFPVVFSRFEWRLVAGRFAERHGLIVIIALGEIILAAGVGAKNADMNYPPTLLLAVAGVVLLATLWGAYFDGSQTAAERALVRAPAGAQQNTMALRAYTLMHLAIVVGILLIALGPESAIAHPRQPFDPHIAGAFFGGLALFLFGHVSFEYITTKRLNLPRLAVGLLMVTLVTFGIARPAWESIVLATSIMTVLVSAQRLMQNKRFRE